MSVVIIPHNEKAKAKLPVELTARDRGGLYVISLDFLPALRKMDGMLMEEFQMASHQQQDFAKVQNKTFVLQVNWKPTPQYRLIIIVSEGIL